MTIRESSGKPLTYTFIKNIREPGRYGDGRGSKGLSLLAKRTLNGRWSKTWSQRIRQNGRETSKGLGSWPTISLAMAREAALDNARQVAQGHDITKPKAEIATVDNLFDEVIELWSKTWEGDNTKSEWLRAKKICRQIGSLPVSQVSTPDVLQIITPLWHTKGDTARTVRSKLHSIFNYAIHKGLAEKNPAPPTITQSLGKQAPKKHHKTITYKSLGDALASVRDSDYWWAERSCIIWIALTGVRSREAREAKWEEINLEELIWTIPADRMKRRVEHQVPLSKQAVSILMYARAQQPEERTLIFPSTTGKLLGDNRLSLIFRLLEIPATPHGMRASLRTWAAEKTNLSEPAAEMLLAHRPKQEVVRIYMTSNFYEDRVPAMQEWADHLTQTMGDVVPTDHQEN